MGSFTRRQRVVARIEQRPPTVEEIPISGACPRGREANREDSGDETGSAMTISRIDARAIAVARFLNAAS